MTTGLNLVILTLATAVLPASVVTSRRAEASPPQSGAVDVCAALPREEAMKTVTVTFPATGTGQQQNITVVTLKRLSGIEQMIPVRVP